LNLELEAKITDLQTEIASEKDKALRAVAEMENFKKRKEKEMTQFCQYANEKIVTELLPVLDSFDRACEHAVTKEKSQKDMLHGFQLIQKQFHQALGKIGVKPIEAIGTQFNPEIHQAVLQEENKDFASNTVIREMQKGYELNSRVIRPSMVVVAK